MQLNLCVIHLVISRFLDDLFQWIACMILAFKSVFFPTTLFEMRIREAIGTYEGGSDGATVEEEWGYLVR